MKSFCVGVALVASSAVLSCDRASTHEITVVDGASIAHFEVKSAFAEYIEVAGVRDQLTLTLSSYPLSCERWVAPHEGDSALTIVIVSPPGSAPSVGTYPWSGIPAADQPLKEPYALPKAQFGDRSRLFEPGGSVRLTALRLESHGTIAGTVAFEFPGTAESPATRIDGSFDAKVCRLSLAAR